MNSPAEILSMTRSAAAALVEREEIRTGSRMAAYEVVASMVGVSADWIRKYVSDRPEAKAPGFIAGLNIIEQYRRLCSRVEEDNQTRMARIAALRERIDAAVPRSIEEMRTVVRRDTPANPPVAGEE